MNTNLEKGIEAENMVAEQLLFRNKELELEQNHTWGIDIVLNQDNRTIKIEVKSSQSVVRNKGGKNGVRRGKFSIQLTDLEREIDYFAFVIYKSNNKATTYWVKGNVIREHFETRKRNKKLAKKLALGIPTLLNNIPKIDFSEVIGLK